MDDGFEESWAASISDARWLRWVGYVVAIVMVAVLWWTW